MGPASPRTTAAVNTQYARLPLAFEENREQTDGHVQFLARGGNYLLFLTSGKAVLKLARPEGGGPSDGKPGWVPVPPKIEVLKIGLSGANPRAKITGVGELPGRTASFIGNDPSKWRRDIPSYGRVVYEDLYPGIDLAFYGKQGQMEFDFILKPGAKPEAVSLDISGAGGLSIGPAGDLILKTSGGTLQWTRPAVYQELDGRRTPVEGRFVLKGTRVGIALGPYDPARPVVVDPVLAYSTYLGGSGSDRTYSIALDSTGAMYVCGVTSSTNFPTAFPLQPNNHGAQDAFLAKLSAVPTLTATASATPTSGQAPLAVSFTGSASGGTAPYTYAWSFGDSITGSGAATTHTYSSAGVYPVTLTVTDSASLAVTDSHLVITVAAPAALTVNATVTPLSGNAPLAVTFAGTASGGVPPYAYAWTFGDSTSGAGASISHTYTASGTFTVRATVTDSASVTASAATTVQAINPPAISSVSKAGNPFRLKIYGSNFHSNCTVKVNGASVPLSQYKSPSLVIAKKGAALKAMVLKGVTVQITVTNNEDGGVSAPFSFTW
ncbi:MAG: PKD domain-containing protein [Acidobacteriota bacterium]